MCPGLILTAPAPKCGRYGADQRHRVERTLQKRDVPQQSCQPLSGWIALYPAAPDREQDEGEVGPGRLVLKPGRQRLEIAVPDRLVRHQGCSSAGCYGMRQGRQVPADFSVHPRFRQDRAGDGGIAPERCEDQDPFGA